MRLIKAFKHFRAILFLPFTALIIVPVFILHSTGDFKPGWPLCFTCLFGPLIFSVILCGFGLILLITTIHWFASIGKGTLAPWDPTQKLVIRGVYRHVRNPMISGVLLILLAETVFFTSWFLFTWFLFLLILNLVYIPLFEERSLERRFGESYRLYKQNVPRWIPRLEPWIPPGETS